MLKTVNEYVEQFFENEENLERYIERFKLKTGIKLTRNQIIEALQASARHMAYNHAFLVLSGNNVHVGRRSKYYNKPKHLPKFVFKLKPKKKK
jgi:hypothetical protein